MGWKISQFLNSYLLERKPNLLEVKDKYGNTLLNIAEKYKTNKVLTLLQTASANLNATKKTGETRFPNSSFSKGLFK